MTTTTQHFTSASPKVALSGNQNLSGPSSLATVSSTLLTTYVLLSPCLLSTYTPVTHTGPIALLADLETRIYTQITMLQNSTCRTLCKSTVPPEDAKFINDRIKEDQAINWLVDGLPAAEMKKDEKSDTIFYDIGFNLGNDEGQYTDTPALYNHYDVLIQ